MKILFVSYSPMTYNGIANQLYEMVSTLENIQTAFVCLNVRSRYSRKGFTFQEYISLFPCTRKNIHNELCCLHNSLFYISDGLQSIWEKVFIWHNEYKPDKIIFYTNIDIFESYNIPKLLCKMYLWIPIHEDFSENNSQVNANRTLQFLMLFDKITTFSTFGQKVLEKWGYESTFINHIIDSKVFYNKYIRNDNRFICLIVANNACPVYRKALHENILSFRKFSLNKETLLIIKSEPIGTVNIYKSIEGMSNVIIVNENIPETELVKLYCISNVLLAASKSEGFGVPIVEAQFCGTPVITTNCTSMPENTFNGICIDPLPGCVKINGINSWANPGVDNIVNALEMVYSGNYSKKDIPKMNYSKEKISKEWKMFLDL